MVTFTNSNGLFNVSGSTEISVRVDVAENVSGQTVGAELSSYTVANGSPMSSSVSGNLFTTALVNNLATVQLSSSNNANNAAVTGPGATINAGTLNTDLWEVPINVGQRSVLFKHIAFTQIGSIPASALQNLHLLVDGNQVGQTTSIMNVGGQNQVVFDLTGSPITLTTGGHTIQLNGDVVTGTSFNFDFSLQTAADAVFYDTNYNVNVPITFSGGGQIFQLNPVTTTINSGTVSIQQDPSYTATQFVKNSSGVDLGQWLMKAYGEQVNVQSMQVQIVYTTSTSTAPTAGSEGFNNLSLNVNGGSVGSSQSALYGTGCSGSGTIYTCTYTFGTTNLFSIPAGQSVSIMLKGDSVLAANTLVTAVQGNLYPQAQTFQGATSYALSPAGATLYTGPTLTLTSSNGTTAENAAYTNQTISSNTTMQHIGSYVIQASSVEGIRVNSLTILLGGTGTSTNFTTWPTCTLPLRRVQLRLQILLPATTSRLTLLFRPTKRPR